MAYESTRNVLYVFLASPGDLNDERLIAKKVTDRINHQIGRQLLWHIELLGWEDTLPGHGRPQAIINQEVDSCDLFVGLLWRRWGQPTGEYSSGFEEEFERACERKEQTEAPEVWLFFKEVEAETVGDPGEQLSRVLDFRRRQVKERRVLFKEFSTPEDWQNKFDDFLTRFVLDLGIESLKKNLAASISEKRPL